MTNPEELPQSDDDIDKWLADLEQSNESYDVSRILPPLAQTDPESPEEPEGTPEDGETPPAEEPPEPTQPEPTGYNINGNLFSHEDIERLYNFDQYLRTHPDVAQRVAETIQSSVQPPQPPVPTAQTPPPDKVEFETPTPPEWMELDDPVQKFAWDSHIETQKQLHEARQEFSQYRNQVIEERQQRINQQAAQDMDIALDRFRTRFPGLNDDDIMKIRRDAGPIVPTMLQQLPPVDALYRSMEVTAWADGEIRPRLANETPEPTRQQKSATRKQRLGEIAGTPRSAPKTEGRVPFASDRDMVNTLAREIADAGFNGQQ